MEHYSLNINNIFLRKNSIMAPQISLENFKSLLMAYGCTLYNNEWELAKNVDCPYDLDKVVLDIFKKPSSAIFQDIKDSDLDFENFPTNFKMTKSGIPYLRCFGQVSPDFLNFVYILYFDGNNFRCYIPRYGNTIFVPNPSEPSNLKIVDDFTLCCASKLYLSKGKKAQIINPQNKKDMKGIYLEDIVLDMTVDNDGITTDIETAFVCRDKIYVNPMIDKYLNMASEKWGEPISMEMLDCISNAQYYAYVEMDKGKSKFKL